MYRNNTFRFYSIANALTLPEMFLPQRLDALTSIHVDFRYSDLLTELGFLNRPPGRAKTKTQPLKLEQWTYVWNMLESLPSLKRIRVDLRMTRAEVILVHKPYCDLVLQPMLSFDRELVHFQLHWPWALENATLFADAPFRLRENDEEPTVSCR